MHDILNVGVEVDVRVGEVKALTETWQSHRVDRVTGTPEDCCHIQPDSATRPRARDEREVRHQPLLSRYFGSGSCTAKRLE